MFVKSRLVWKVYAVRPPVMTRVRTNAFTTTSASYILTTTPTVIASTTVNAASSTKLMGTWCLKENYYQCLKRIKYNIPSKSIIGSVDIHTKPQTKISRREVELYGNIISSSKMLIPFNIKR